MGSCLPGGGTLRALGPCHLGRSPWSSARPFTLTEADELRSCVLVLIQCLGVTPRPVGDVCYVIVRSLGLFRTQAVCWAFVTHHPRKWPCSPF